MTSTLDNPAQETRFPASFAQARLWFVDQLEPGGSHYNVPVAWGLEGELDEGALARALDEVVARHEVLRTRFEAQQGVPVQVVSEAVSLGLMAEAVPAGGDAEAWALEQARAEARRPFSLAQGGLVRARLLALGPQRHVLLLTLHHIVCDGWSMDLLYAELGACYDRQVRGGAALAELPIQYGDFAAWQREWLQGEVLEAQLGYWRRTLADAPPMLDLPLDHPRPARRERAGDEVELVLEGEAAEAVRGFGRQAGCTLFMTMATAFNVLLGRYTRQDDICLGYPVANRSRPELEGLVGFFVNTLVLRTRRRGEDSFAALAGRVREAVLEAGAHQDVPFERLVEALGAQRTLEATPLFQAMLSVHSDAAQGAAPLALGDVRASFLAVPAGTAKFDLSLHVVDRGARLMCTFEYDTQLFERRSIEQMARHFAATLRACTAQPERPLAQLALLSDDERRALLMTGRMPSLPPRCVHELFEERARIAPQAVAVQDARTCLSYAQLDARANQLAHRLRALGVAGETLVGVYLERSIETIVALLGVLKAGAAYVPLDVEAPPQRLAYMLADTAAPVVLTQEALAARLPASPALLLAIDADRELARCPVTALQTLARPSHLAYCIYTSGSTGQPKAALNPHAGVVNWLLWMQAEYGLAEDDVVLLKTPSTFDVSAREFFWPLIAGARIAVADRGAHRDPAALRALIDAHGVTAVHFVPPMLQAFLESETDYAPATLRRVLCSGEALPSSTVQALVERWPAVVLCNLYGPTECAVEVSAWSHNGTTPRGRIPIGRAISNVRLYILDDRMEPVPDGVPGQLWIAGIAVGRGYLNRPDLTAEQFVPDPYGEPGSRMYDTGDLARRLPSGEIDFLGRIDHQVKILGVRIEPQEIQNALLGCAGVREACVLAADVATAGKRLVAYVACEDAAWDTAALRRALARTLPETMLPTAWVRLPTLPVNVNGKVDARALPAPQQDESAGNHVPPRTPAERMLAELWAQALKRSQVGIEDDFFALGGHSLLVLSVYNALAARTGVRPPVRLAFSHRTIARFAAELWPDGEVVDAAITDAPGVETLAQAPGPVREAPLSFAQQPMWERYRRNAAAIRANNVPLYFLWSGDGDAGAAAAALTRVLERHDALNVRFEPRGDAAVQVLQHEPVAWDVLASGTVDLAEALHLSEAYVRAPFDLEVGSPRRGAWQPLEDGTALVLLVFNHLVIDGWSAELLTQELLAAGTPPHAPPHGYLAHATADRLREGGAAFEATRRYWREKLATPLAGTDDLAEGGRPPQFTGECRTLALQVPPERAHGLRRAAAAWGCPSPALFAAVFGRLLAEQLHLPEAAIAVPVQYRPDDAARSTIGLFVHTVILRLRSDAGAHWIAAARDEYLASIDHMAVPPSVVLDLLGAPAPGCNFPAPFFLNYQSRVGEIRTAGVAGDLRALPWEPPARAKCDLCLQVLEDAEGIELGLVAYAGIVDEGRLQSLGAALAGLLNELAHACDDAGTNKDR